MVRIKSLLLLTFLLFPSLLLSQNLSKEKAEEFIRTLIEENDDLESIVFPEELNLSKRLNIEYNDVKFKFLISYDIEPSIKEKLRLQQIKYEIQIEKLENDYSLLRLTVPENNYRKDYYFKGHYLISPIFYYTRNWDEIESEHFRFYVSDPGLFNFYCVYKLENFFEQISTTLNYTEEEIERLRNNKICYFLCSEEKEIKLLTDYHSRGMYNLAYDYIITTFNCHYHELMHLLINYKLHKLPLYTHPFLQEGFAVSLGGRGGKEPKVILNLGIFLEQSNILKHSELLNIDEFSKNDASLSYPSSGLYNFFLIDKMGIKSYLKQYLKYSSNSRNTLKQSIPENELPPDEKWMYFLSEFSKQKLIEVENDTNNLVQIYNNPALKIFENSTHYLFQAKNTLLFSTNKPIKDYQSKKFMELLPNKKYAGEKYLVLSNANEISIYNLYTNNLIASFVATLSLPIKNIPQKNGYFEFFIQKDLFDEPLNQLSINSY